MKRKIANGKIVRVTTIGVVLFGIMFSSCTWKGYRQHRQQISIEKTVLEASKIKIGDRLDGIVFRGTYSVKALGFSTSSVLGVGDVFIYITSQEGDRVIGLQYIDYAGLFQATQIEGTFDGQALNYSCTKFLFLDFNYLVYGPLGEINKQVNKPGDPCTSSNTSNSYSLILLGSIFDGSGKSSLGGKKISTEKIKIWPIAVPDFILSNYEQGNQKVVGYAEERRMVYTIEVKDGKPVPGTFASEKHKKD